ncbi:LysR family transcriptional regulator [Pelagibius litoralis]|uniref:LysR family transcriptional regulator n=1 Tax=Pelagibius litoralis TaxID=374515 RepID=A0A967KAH2_9PROT|nr:LysR family transcriptional regulator [Pelagibius litoralis]NIA71638.1 LysR family transcriptional regulator [Pelagibius litoralis]
MSRLDEMAVFAEVVEAEGFSAAARVLGVSKSAVSKQVGRLEDRLGVRLLNRTTRRLSLTEAGATFYEASRRVLDEALVAETAVSSLSAAPRGLLKLNAPMSFGFLHLARVIPEFHARYPRIVIDAVMNDRFVDLVEEGYDVAIRITGALQDSSLIARYLAPSQALLCAAPDYLAQRGTPLQPEDLSGHDCLIYSNLDQRHAWRFAGPRGPVRVKVKGPFQANNGDALCSAALAGMGIAALPSFIVGEHLLAGRLVPVLCGFRLAAQGIYAVYPHNRNLSAKVRAFVDFLAGRFGPEPYWDDGLDRVLQPAAPMQQG